VGAQRRTGIDETGEVAMHLRNLRRVELLALALLALAGASVCRIGWGGPASRLATSPANLEISALQDSFRVPPEDAKIMVRWWWFGPAVTTEELDREMHAMKDAGIGGFEVATVYPLTVDDPSRGLVNLRYLSPEHLAAVSSTARTAHELGLRMDMTMGSGWPYGGPHITPELAAEGLRCLRIPIQEGARTISGPQLKVGLRFLAAFVATGDGSHFDASSAYQISPREDGSFRLPPSPAGPRVLLLFEAGLTGQHVKRAAVGAEGLVLDHYNRAALQKHLEAVGAPLAAAGGGNIRAMFCDSLEVYDSDWTAGLLKEFQRRRGYDLTPYLPVLVADSGPQTAALRHDWGLTLGELLNQNFLAPYQAWCHQHNMLCRVQAYGTPPAQLSSYRFADLPEGEQGDEAGHWNHFTPTRWASSAGHLYGAPVISAEAWTWIHALPFRATPLDFKASADEYFLEGINQLVGHGWPYSPPGVPEPGWHLYAAGALDPHNPWWFAMSDLALYLQRASFMLRRGKPANDIAVYLPTHDAWADISPSHVNLWAATWRKLGPDLVPSLLEAGYNLDFVDDEILAQEGRIEKGKLAIANQEFSIVILPGVERIPPTTLAKLGEFSQSGGTLIATRRLPSLAPGFLHQETGSAEVARQVEDLFQKPSARGHFVPSETKPLEDELARLYVPDVAFSPRSQNLGFIHRHTDTAEIYFIANTSNQRAQATATFRVKGKNPEWWDLFTGEATTAQVLHLGGDEGTVIPLDLEPYGSRVLVFTDRGAPREMGPTEGRREVSDISRDWDVTFEGTGKKMVMDFLRPWTGIEGLHFFSGRATYQRKFYIPSDSLRKGNQVDLNLGEATPIPIQKEAHFQAWLDGPVREAAEVYVNGRRAGTIWHPPYELDVTPFLHAGENELRIVVGNTAVNEMAGSPVPDRTQLTARYGERFVDQGNELVQPVPSGLTGPIRLITRRQPAVVRTSP
jgi:hypothetical protein